MRIFGKNIGGLMDQIRCDEEQYLVWKWHPNGTLQGESNRENAIRWGSSLRVKEGEVAVFVYNQPSGTLQDFIMGPFDGILKTKNLPVLADFIGLGYDGGTPFQAEIFFINLAKLIQLPFAVPFFDIYDPRILDIGVPVSVRGKITFNIQDYKNFIKLNRLRKFDLQELQNQIKEIVTKSIKIVVTNIPVEHSIPVIHIEKKLSLINNLVEEDLRTRLGDDFGLKVVSLDISAIEIDKTDTAYLQLLSVTREAAVAIAQAETDVKIKNLYDLQHLNTSSLKENLRIQQEESQYAQRKQTQSDHFSAYQLEQQTAVGIAGAEALGKMGDSGVSGALDPGGLNPATMMTGLAIGGVVGQNIAGMMNGVMSGFQQPSIQGSAPPPIYNSSFYVVLDGQPIGPLEIHVLRQMIMSGTLTGESLVWKQGMLDWVNAKMVPELINSFEATGSNLNGQVPPIPPSF